MWSKLTLSALSAILTLSLFACSNSALGQDSKEQSVRVPVAPPRFPVVIAGEEVMPWAEPTIPEADEIYLNVPAGTDFFGGSPPKDIWDAADVIRHTLPIDYKEMLMKDFGYERVKGESNSSNRADLRKSDLARFLFKRWVFADPQTQLAKEFACLSWGEFDITPFLKFVTEAEAEDYKREEDRVWRKRRLDQSMSAVSSSHRLLLGRCQDLINLGASVDDF
ncbi:MAG: hypothetical protein ABGW84_13330 [Sphingomonadaceae bacterium]